VTKPDVASSLNEIAPAPRPSVSLFRKRLRKFRALKRGYYSFLFLLAVYGTSFFLPVLVNNEALLVRYDGRFYYPLLRYYSPSTFGQETIGEPDYRLLAETFREENVGNWAILPPYPYSPTDALKIIQIEILHRKKSQERSPKNS